MNKILALAAAAAVGMMATTAQAQNCGGTYIVQSGDTLSGIANRLYRNASLWSAIQQANIDLIGDRPDRIIDGMPLRMTCIDGLPTGLANAVDVAQVRAAARPLVVPQGTATTRTKVNLLTGGDYAPFTDQSLPAGGMLTEVVQRSMEAAAPSEGFAIHWVNDWGSHHEPLLSNALLDVGFPWIKPDCDADPTNYRCENLVFSDPMFEMLILLFVDTDRPMAYRTNADMVGRTLCRPVGYATYFFNTEGRDWLNDGVITLRQPDQLDDCFRMLTAGEVDAVVLNEFTGRQKIKELGLTDRVEVAAGLPITIDGLHVVVHKSHPRADELMTMVNEGLTRIKANGTYQRTIDEHLTRIWAEF